jgi:hypothetical protein
MDYQATPRNVDGPALPDVSAGIEVSFGVEVEAQGCVRNFDQKQQTCRNGRSQR